MFRIGDIINTHGLHGEVKVRQITDFIERFNVGSTVYITIDQETIELIIDSFRQYKQHIYLKFSDYSTVESVEKFKGCSLKIKQEQLTELEEDEFYFYEIIGCTVVTTDGEKIGIIDHILTPGANDVWVVKSEKGKEYLIPYIEDIVKHVNVTDKVVTIEPMEGLLE